MGQLGQTSNFAARDLKPDRKDPQSDRVCRPVSKNRIVSHYHTQQRAIQHEQTNQISTATTSMEVFNLDVPQPVAYPPRKFLKIPNVKGFCCLGGLWHNAALMARTRWSDKFPHCRPVCHAPHMIQPAAALESKRPCAGANGRINESC